MEFIAQSSEADLAARRGLRGLLNGLLVKRRPCTGYLPPAVAQAESAVG